MRSIPNLEMPPALGPQPKGDAPVDKLELSGEVLTGLCGLATLGSGQCCPLKHVLASSTNLSLLKTLINWSKSSGITTFSLLPLNYNRSLETMFYLRILEQCPVR